MSLPNLIIAGPPKCGTTSLYFWLAAHPEVCASKIKETFYFNDRINKVNKNLNFLNDGIEGYSKHFENCTGEKVIFEATPTYIYSKVALEQIPKLSSKPKVLFVLREPVKRLKSLYLFARYKTGTVSSNFMDFSSSTDVLKQGDYAHYLKKWQEALGAERMKVIVFEELLKDLNSGMEDLAQYLNVDPAFYQNYDFSKVNETVTIRSKALHRLSLKIITKIPTGIKKAFTPLYFRLNSSGKPEMTKEEKNHLESLKPKHELFIKKLEEFLGREIPLWK